MLGDGEESIMGQKRAAMNIGKRRLNEHCSVMHRIGQRKAF